MYRLLVRLAFPRRVRRLFAEDMVRLFDQQLVETRAAGGSVFRLWLHAIGDAILHGTAERIAILGAALQVAAREVRRDAVRQPSRRPRRRRYESPAPRRSGFTHRCEDRGARTDAGYTDARPPSIRDARVLQGNGDHPPRGQELQ